MRRYLKFAQYFSTFAQVWVFLVPFRFQCLIKPRSLFQRHGDSAKYTRHRPAEYVKWRMVS